MPDRLFAPEPEYSGVPRTRGALAEAYLENTLGLRRANNKLRGLCKAARRCKAKDMPE